jgi:hypothetical protein
MSSSIPQGYVDPSRPNPGTPYSARVIIWGYVPNLSFASVGLATFALLAIVHMYLAFRYRVRYFSLVISGCLFEITGYAFRMVAYLGNVYDYRWFVVSYFFTVVAPVLFSAAIYTCLSSLIRTTGKWTGKQGKSILITFVSFDVVCTIAQVGGAGGIGAATSNGRDPSGANKAIIAGLAVQTAALLVFLVLLARFAFTSPSWRLMGMPLQHVASGGSYAAQNSAYHLLRVGRDNIPSHIIILLVSAFLIFLRTVFRLAESAEGVYSEAATNEVLFALLDYLPVILAVILLALGHPGKYTKANIDRVAASEVPSKDRA